MPATIASEQKSRSLSWGRPLCIREFRMAVFRKVVVVGAGTMGSQIALQTAYSGHYEAALVDSSPQQGGRWGGGAGGPQGADREGRARPQDRPGLPRLWKAGREPWRR